MQRNGITSSMTFGGVPVRQDNSNAAIILRCKNDEESPGMYPLIAYNLRVGLEEQNGLYTLPKVCTHIDVTPL